jgi:hypothetical protein
MEIDRDTVNRIVNKYENSPEAIYYNASGLLYIKEYW